MKEWYKYELSIGGRLKKGKSEVANIYIFHLLDFFQQLEISLIKKINMYKSAIKLIT